MSDAPILSCDNVSVRYRVGDIRNIGLKEVLIQKLKGKRRIEDFYAVENVSFSLGRGDFLGIIGSNGAGKSTLLKAISGIMAPSAGSISCTGRVTALLELASGFDGDLTVKENAYLRGALLGYTRAYMDKAFDSIIDFAELRGFENWAFRQLSSGMRSRLAFSIAARIKPEILIIDEVLSVGDVAFRAKSEARMKEIIAGGATTILVSHSLAQIRSMCNKILWLDHGHLVAFSDDVAGICGRYEEYLRKPLAERGRHNGLV